jgi:hypothetical protein
MDSVGSGQRPMAGSYQHGDETSGSIRGWEFLERLKDCRFLKDWVSRS